MVMERGKVLHRGKNGGRLLNALLTKHLPHAVSFGCHSQADSRGAGLWQRGKVAHSPKTQSKGNIFMPAHAAIMLQVFCLAK